MNPTSQSVELRTILTELGPRARLAGPSDLELSRLVHGAVVWVPGDTLPDDPGVVVACTGIRRGVNDLDALMSARRSLIVLICDASIPTDKLASSKASSAHVLGVVDANAGELVAIVARLTQSAEQAVSRRLGSLQRSLSIALADPAPVPTLLHRLRTVSNATAALITPRGDVVHSTGPVPRALLVDELSSNKAETQVLNIDGWNGVGVSIPDLASPGQHSGWLVTISRRTNFPSTYDIAAVQVAANLIETSQRMGIVVRQQEKAIRAAVLEQALALRREKRDAELAARVASLGITFETEARIAVATFTRSMRADQRRAAAERLQDQLARILGDAGLSALLTNRDNGVTMLVQTDVSGIRRLLSANQDAMPALHIGIGRALASVDHALDSYNDAQLAVRTLQRVAPTRSSMAYEDFDFATRLFADVGLDRMITWAEEFLHPLTGRDNLLTGLRAYFENDQNIIAAAEALHIHHNSLRYRLSKVEELLGISLKRPAVVSSLFLALTALDLTSGPSGLRPSSSRTRVVGEIHGAEDVAGFDDGHRGVPGVVRPDSD